MGPIRILIINPNTNQSMTDSLREPVERLDYNNSTYTFLTGPSGVPSINNESDAAISATACLPTLLPHLPTHDAFLIACYSPHPLVSLLKTHTAKPVLGIFEASVQTAIQLLGQNGTEERFGIVSTGRQWCWILGDAVRESILGAERAAVVFAGVESWGCEEVGGGG
ncbi:hypothetical protein N7G274_009103 [Stereocaulon virgatum]|uniref:Asp/Glu racemase n=1 Tax=Stereocaulon virgatum TaxID=373712 RepID=A0ABR3ZY76_9LECA